MGKHSRCVIDICENDMQYPELHGKHSNLDGNIIMYKLRKDGAVKAAWINRKLKGRKQLIQESLHTFVTTSLLGWLINSSIVFPSAEYFSSPSPIYHKQIKSINRLR